LLHIFGVPANALPALRTSDSHFGNIADRITALPAGTPIHAMMGDSHAALFGHGVRTPGTVKATYGTGSSLMTLTGARLRSLNGLSSTIAWSTASGRAAYALEGNISVSGQAVAFIGELLGLGDAQAIADLAASVQHSNGVVFVPALVGLGAPHWVPEARGVLSGLSLATKPAHLARAAIEAIAQQVADVFEAMEQDLGSSLAEISADGGASRNDMLMQYQADILGRPVTRGDRAEVSALGAAMMAAQGMGRTISPHKNQTAFAPRIPEHMRDKDRTAWREAIGRTLWRQEK
jgi:glycerol kinase